MKFKHGGYYADGSLAVYGQTEQGVTVALFRGYMKGNSDLVTLYPVKIFMPTSESTEKQTISIFNIKKEN